MRLHEHLYQEYKVKELSQYFCDWLKDQDPDWIEENIDDIHHHAFNANPYIIGRHRAKQWLSDEVFNVIDLIKQYEQFNFGEVTTDFSDPEKIVNMYAYIIGEEVVQEWLFMREYKKAGYEEQIAMMNRKR